MQDKNTYVGNFTKSTGGFMHEGGVFAGHYGK